MKRLWIALPLLALATGCPIATIDALDPKVGGALLDRCVNEDSDKAHAVSFKNDLLPILTGMRKPQIPGCSCHQPSDPNPIGFEQTGLNLSSLATLREGGATSRERIVIPGQPCDSVIWQKLSSGPPFGSRMPLSGPPFLDDATRQLISDWIAEGALDD